MSSSILPDDHAQFTSKDYWDKFFTQRGQFAFEWYGDFKEVFPCLSLSRTDRILVIGCGNSNFSSDLYDKGYHSITNLDFSELVIEEMRGKNVSRSEMAWIVGDMTRLTTYFAEGSFDVIIDKGALDALMSNNNEELTIKAKEMFDEISKSLTATGRYYLITLGEDYIFRTIANYFMKTVSEAIVEYNWNVTVAQVTTAKPSPFVPLFLTFAKSTTPNCGKAIVSISAVNARRELTSRASNKSLPTSQLPFEELIGFVRYFQEFNQLSYRVAKLQVGRFETVPLWSNESTEVPRFTLYILDVSEQAQLSCAVFFIPFGREADYQFTTQDGLIDIAFQAACKRLFVVACNRPHVFGEMPQLQDELSPIITSLKLTDMDPTEKIPYMAVAQDKAWEEIEQGKSQISGIYVVEEQEDEDKVYRRLIFLQNQQFVQTEIRLVKRSAAKKKGKSKGKSKPTEGESNALALAFDYKYLDDHHKGMIASLTLYPALVLSASQRSNALSGLRALVVGLGGGALTMALQKYMPSMKMISCDIDAMVYEVAKKHFGFEASSNTEIVIQDGIALLHQMWEQCRGGNDELLQDLIIIDVDSKDPSLGLSAPPREFISFENLEHMHQLLKPGGLLIFNVVARSKSMLNDFIGRVKMVFNAQASSVLTPSSLDHLKGRILEMKPASENVNICLVCVKGGGVAPLSSIPTSKSNKKSSQTKEHVQWEKTLATWLTNCACAEDPLELEELLTKLHDV